LLANDRSAARQWIGGVLRERQPILFALVKPFMFMMGNVFGDGVAMVRLAKSLCGKSFSATMKWVHARLCSRTLSWQARSVSNGSRK
jgi:hypothetical protein